MTSLTVILPAHDESEAIRAGRLAAVVAWAAGQPDPTEVLVVDDGSTDGTPELAESCGATVLRIPHGGKAAALKAGLHAARGERMLVTDMDQATPITEAPKLLEALSAGADVAFGSRGHSRPGAPLGRRVLSLGQWVLCRLLVGLPWSDTQCGFKAFRRAAAVEALGRLRRYAPGSGEVTSGPSVSSGFDVEFLLVARKAGRVLVEVPVAWNYRDTRRVAKLRDACRGTWDLLVIAAASRCGLYDGPPRRDDAVE